MRLRLFAPILTGLAVALGINTTLNQPSYAGNTTFFCGRSNSVPVTYARTPRGNVPMIRWVSNNYFPPPWTAERRCQEVARRFQRNYDHGMLKGITTGTLRGEPVVCAATGKIEPCTDRTLLFTLKRGSNANITVQRLLDRRGLAAGNLLNENGGDSPIYVDVDEYLNNATADENTESTSQSGESSSESSGNPWW